MLDRRVAIVTGAARGIGLAITHAFAQEHADVVMVDLLADEVSQEAERLRQAGWKAAVRVSDVADGDAVEDLVQSTISQRGRIDILVNNAAVLQPKSSLTDLSTEMWDKIFSVNLRSMFLMSRTVANQAMIPQQQGKIINLTSIAGMVVRKGIGAYCVAKAGTIMLTKVLALELAEHGITVNAICPGSTDTHQTRGDSPDVAAVHRSIVRGDLDAFRLGIPLGRLAQPEEQAQAALFLASAAADHMTGQSIVIDGGQTLA